MIELVGPFFGESATAKREREVQQYQERELIRAKELLARAEGILEARFAIFERDPETPLALLPSERELLALLAPFRKRGLFPPREGGR